MVFISASLAAQTGLDGLLRSVEANNVNLQAARSNFDARSLEARMGNSLDDLSIGYDHMWGNSSELGQTGEFTVSQSFDFPTVYARRNRVAGNLAEQYENEYLDMRQQVLLEAKELYIELQSLMRRADMMKFRMETTLYLKDLYAAKYEAGDATIIEKSKFEYEYLILLESYSEYDMRIIEIESRLKSLNGGEAVTIAQTDDPFEQTKPFEQALADYETFAPSLLALQLQEKGAEYDVKLSRSQAVPKFEVGYKHEFSPGEKFNGVTVGLSIPIFSNRNNVKRAKAMQTAAKLDVQAAQVEASVVLSEMYRKAEALHASLGRYGSMPSMEEYESLVRRALDAGEINVVDYFSEVYTYYDVLESRFRLETEYRISLARINMIYL